MNGTLAGGSRSAVDDSAYARAILNILDDLGEERDRLTDTQRAMLNILDDTRDERATAAQTVRATINILEDLDDERHAAIELQQAMLNVLEDADDGRARSETTVQATLNILDDLDAERARLAQAHADLTAASEGLERANQELESFSYSVAHDLRSPLRAIAGYSQILLEGHSSSLDAEGRRLLGVVIGNAERMAALIDDLLEFARVSRLPLSLRQVDMTTLVRLVFNELHALQPERTIELTLEPLGPAWCDVATIRQVWVNLLSNALKFTRHQEVARIEVRATSGPGEVVYSVRDDGAGFDMRFAAKLFGVFERLHSPREFEGTGIGLAIVRRVVERHGGRVQAEGEVGMGATFSFSLPVGGSEGGG